MMERNEAGQAHRELPLDVEDQANDRQVGSAFVIRTMTAVDVVDGARSQQRAPIG
jgi:hypothetical protein